jgi:hypothetical protein
MSRAMKVGLMAEQVHFGNDEPSNQLRRLMSGCRHLASPTSSSGQVKMRISAQSIKSSSNFPLRATLGLLALAAVAFASGISTPANAGPRPGAYDGTWNVTFTTRAGNCSATNSAPFNVAGTQVSSAGGGKVTGGISRGGAVAVNISVGLSHASGRGRLVGNSGTGRWTGIISGDKCSGTWAASRT